MSDSHAARYEAFRSHDPRFDGVFYVGVTSTRIYCRPICTARTPKSAHCRFYASRELAERAGFRPCLRCRPELAPGDTPLEESARVARAVADRIASGVADGGAGIEAVARRLGWSSRQLRRVVNRELGVSPIELLQTRRLLLAKQLLTETSLPVTQVAFASGFASLRRFNDLFSRRYGMPPSRFRRTATDSHTGTSPEATLTLHLDYRPPLDWSSLLGFLAARSTAGVESVAEHRYARTVQLGESVGWLVVGRHPRRDRLSVELAPTLTPVLPALLTRLRHLFDLAARPDLIDAHLGRDTLLAPLVRAHPGGRVAGAFDGFELAVRAVLGQQITVAAATTLAGRLAARFGDPLATPHPALDRLFPTARRMATVSVADIASLGVIATRARAIVALARAIADHQLDLAPGAHPERTMQALIALPGIGPWTAHYIAMRALGWPDAFPPDDVVLRRRLNGSDAASRAARAATWQPWRSYATLLLWQHSDTSSSGETDVQ
jgi:AraC family transcriptional regulator of adaptative response / DNA-3-methyladenine glycosylase II